MGKGNRLITDVQVKEIDDSSRYLYPSRRIEIKTPNNTFYTPIRASTSYEFKLKAKVPSDTTLDNPISIDIQHLTIPKFLKFMNTNEFYSKLLRSIEINNRMSQYSDINLVLLKPSISDKKDEYKNVIQESPMNMITKNNDIKERFLRFNINIQRNLNLNPITIPFLNIGLKSFKEISFDVMRSLDRINIQPLFFIDMEYDAFDDALDWLINNLELNAVGLYYRPFINVPLSYETLSKYVDKDVAFISSQITRRDITHYDISVMHYLPFFGNDVYSVFTPSSGGPAKGDPLRSIRLFNADSLCLNQIISNPSLVENIRSEYVSDFHINNILDHYYEARTDKKKLEVLRAFSKVSEIKRSTMEFKNLQDYVSQNSTNDYIQGKNVLQRTLLDVTGSQTKIRL